MLDWISHFGYMGLFVALMLGIAGLPVPDETILVFCGYLIATRHMTWPAAFATASAGSMCGITLSYSIGRTAGYAFIHRYGPYVHITERRLENVHAWFRRMGHWLLMFGYFILGVRHLTALVAGAARLEFAVFARFAYVGAILWVATFLAVGYFLSDKWPAGMELVRRYSIWIVVAGLVLGGLYALAHWMRNARKNSNR